MGLGHVMVTRGGINGSGRGNSDTLARGTHGEGGGWSHVHVKLWGKFQCSELLHFLLQPSVFLRQILATSLQKLAVHLRLFQLRPEISFPFILLYFSREKDHTTTQTKTRTNINEMNPPCSSVLEPHLHLSCSKTQLFRQCQLLFLHATQALTLERK